jgi:hypothetical protein
MRPPLQQRHVIVVEMYAMNLTARKLKALTYLGHLILFRRVSLLDRVQVV